MINMLRTLAEHNKTSWIYVTVPYIIQPVILHTTPDHNPFFLQPQHYNIIHLMYVQTTSSTGKRR